MLIKRFYHQSFFLKIGRTYKNDFYRLEYVWFLSHKYLSAWTNPLILEKKDFVT